MDTPYPVVLKPEHQPLLPLIIFELVRPFIDDDLRVLNSPQRLRILADLAGLAWNLSRLDGEPEAAGVARRMRADLEKDSAIAAKIMDELLRRARAVTILEAPTSEHVSVIFEGGTLIVTALPRFPKGARGSEVH